MSTEEKKKIELPRALREIVRILADEGIKTYAELAEKLGKDETTIIRQCQKLIELEVCVKAEKEGKAAIALADNVEIDEEGNAWVPSPFEEPQEKLKQLLEEAGVKGRKLRWIMRLCEANPQALQQPQVLYDTLIGAGIRRHLAEQIVKAYFGTNFVAPPQPPQLPIPPNAPRPNYGYGYGYGYQMPYNPYMPIPPMDRDRIKLEMKLERLMEEIKELKEKESKPHQSAYPVIREIHVTEDGKQVVVEKPIWVASDQKENKALMKIMEEMAKQREETLKLVFTLQNQTKELVEKLANAQQEMFMKFQQMMMEQEVKHKEEMAKLREEMIKRESEWKEKTYQERLRELQQTIEGLKQYYESKTQQILQELKKEWEWRKKLEELESKRGLRDVVIEEIRSIGKELVETTKEARQMVKQYMEANIKQTIAQKQVPKVAAEEKKKILDALKKRAGKATEKKEVKGEEPKVQLKVVGRGE